MSQIHPLLVIVLSFKSSHEFSFLDAAQHSQPATLSPIVLIPAFCGNQLEARLDKAPDKSDGCDNNLDWHRLWLDVWQLRQGNLACWADNIKLVYNSSTRRSSNNAGVFTRVPGWGSTSSLEYLDPSWSAWVLGDAGNYLHSMVDYLVNKLGYERDRNLVGAPYDFRFAPYSQAPFFRQLKTLIEDIYHNNDQRRVTVVSHSMGGLFSLHFFQQQSQAWLDRHIQRFFPLSTPWLGAELLLSTILCGYNMGIDLLDPLVIREEQRSYETATYLLPQADTWPHKGQVLVSTPARNYTVRDYQALFLAMGYPQGWQLLQNVRGITPLRHPRVPTTCIYSLGVDTVQALEYGPGFPESQPARVMGDGDGTVTKTSAEFCRKFLTEDRDRVMVFRGINHGNIVKDETVLQFLSTQLAD